MKSLINPLLFPKIFFSELLDSERSEYNRLTKSYNDTQDSILFFAGNGGSSCEVANIFKRDVEFLDEKYFYNLYAVGRR